MNAIWHFTASNYGFLFCVWAFVGHLYWLRSGYLDFSHLEYPPKREYILKELLGLPVFWLMGPITPLFPYAALRPGNCSWRLRYRYDD